MGSSRKHHHINSRTMDYFMYKGGSVSDQEALDFADYLSIHSKYVEDLRRGPQLRFDPLGCTPYPDTG